MQPGEVTGLLGPNGAGKSTILKIITGILKFAEGNVEVERCKLPAEAFEVKKRIGYVPESAELYESISAMEFLESAHLLPHAGGLAALSVCVMMTFSDQHRAAWIFLTAPLESTHSFVRGIFWSLWFPISTVSLILLPLYIR